MTISYANKRDQSENILQHVYQFSPLAVRLKWAKQKQNISECNAFFNTRHTVCSMRKVSSLKLADHYMVFFKLNYSIHLSNMHF